MFSGWWWLLFGKFSDGILFGDLQREGFRNIIYVPTIWGDKLSFKADKEWQKKIQRNPFKYLIQKSNNLQPFAIPLKILKRKIWWKIWTWWRFSFIDQIINKQKSQIHNKATCVYKNHSEMTMERELKDGLFFKLPYNRLDIMDDIDINHHDLLVQKR